MGVGFTVIKLPSKLIFKDIIKKIPIFYIFLYYWSRRQKNLNILLILLLIT